MAPSSSSTKKAARLAQKGKGQKVRFQGGTLFPMAVAIVVVLGFALVAYARQSRPAADASAPTIDDHWHHVYGFYLCDTWFQLEGDGEARDANGRPSNVQYARSGIHSHDDGLIHWHPFSSVSIGSRARLGVFLDTYDVELDNDMLVFPEDQRPFLPTQQEDGTFENGVTECDGEPGELKAVVWDNISDTDDGDSYIADFQNIRLDQDAMVVAIAFVPDDEEISMPPWTTDFDENVLIDSGQQGANELFPGANIDEDGQLTDLDGEQIDQGDVGPAVTSETSTSDAPADDTATTDAPADSEPADSAPADTAAGDS